MTVFHEIIIGILTLAIFLILDFVWLGLIAKQIYSRYLGPKMIKKPNYLAAFSFYIIFVIGLMVFVIVPSLNLKDLNHLLVYAPLYGLVTYATFDLTSEAVFKDWPTAISIIDILWGIILSSSCATLSYLIATHFIK